MGFNLGKFLQDNIVKPIDKAIIKPIDKAIIKPIDKAIIKPIDKAIIKPIDAAIIKPIDKAIVQPIRERTNKDYALRHERAHVAELEKRNAALRPQFFDAQQDLAEAEAAYELASEDFSKAYGAEFRRLSNIKSRSGPASLTIRNPGAAQPEVLQVLEDGGRFVLSTISLGLSEGLFNKKEIAQERAFLNTKITRLTEEAQKLNHAIRTLRKAEDELRAATDDIKAEHAKLGADATASDVQVHAAREAAQRKIVQGLLDKEVPQDRISDITGIADEVVARMAQPAAS